MGTESETNVKEEKTDVSDLELKIIRQIEHYFGNYNLSKDKFMKEQVKLDDGWVSLDIMVKFNRLKSLTEDFGVICTALKKSQHQLMEVNEENKKIRRRVDKPVPEEGHFSPELADTRSLYVKGFKKNTTLDQILDFFHPYKAEYVCMRRVKGNSKVFKGSCFVLFETLEDAEKFLDLKGIKFEGMELLREKKKDYVARKDVFFNNLREEKAKKLEEAKNIKEKIPDVADLKMTRGCLLKVEGLGAECKRENLQEKLKSYGTIVFTDYFKGNPEGVVRFETPVASKVVEDAEEEDGVKKMEFGSAKATISALEGEDEEVYWKTIAISKAHSRLKHAKFPKQNKGRFKKNWGKRSKDSHRNDENSGQPAAKKAKGDSNVEASNENSDQPPTKKARVEESSDNPERKTSSENNSPAVQVAS